MGKDRNKDVRSKGKPSSSSEAATLLGLSGVTSPTGFIGFSSSRESPEVEQTLDPEYQLAFKALSKKDPITKLKALQELGVLFKGVTDENVQPVLRQWSQAFPRLAIDDDRRVREASNQTFIVLVRSVKKNLAPFLKSLIGVWFVNLFDPYKEVCIAARNALNAAIPVPKQVDAILYCKKELLSFIKENIELPIPQANESTELHERYERLVSGSILCWAFIIESVSDSDNNSLLGEYTDLLTPKFWAFFTSKSALIRKSVYHLLTTLCTKLQMLVEPNLEKLSPLILGIFVEKEPSTHSSMWECVLSFMKVFSDQCWKYVKTKTIFPRLWSFLRNGCYGSSMISYPSLLPFVNFVPIQAMENLAEFYQEFLSNIWKGLQSDYITSNSKDAYQLLTAYLECLKFFIVQARNNRPELEEMLLVKCLFTVAEFYMTTETLPFSQDEIVKMFSDTLNKVSITNTQEAALVAFWSCVEHYAYDIVKRDLSQSGNFTYTRFAQLCSACGVNLDETSKSRSYVVNVVQHVVACCLPLAREKRHIPCLQLVVKLTSSFNCKVVLEGFSVSVLDFFDNYLLPWTTNWLSIATVEEMDVLFSMIRLYFIVSVNFESEWDLLLRVLLSPSTRLKIMTVMLRQICTTEDTLSWANPRLNELASQLIKKLFSEEIQDNLSDYRNVLVHLISGRAGRSLVDTNTLAGISHTVEHEVSTQLLTEEKPSVVLSRCFSALDLVKSVLQSLVALNDIKVKLAAFLFDCQSNTRFHDKKYVFREGLLVHDEEEEMDEDKESLKYCPIALKAREMWAQCAPQLNSTLAANDNNQELFLQLITQKIKGKLSEPLASDQYASIPLMGELFGQLVTNVPSVASFIQPTLNLMLDKTFWDDTRILFNNNVLLEVLDFSVPFETLRLLADAPQCEQTLDLLLRRTIFCTELLDTGSGIQLERVVQSDTVWVVAALLHSMVLCTALPSFKHWDRFRRKMIQFYTDQLLPFLHKTSYELLEEILQVLLQQALEHGKVHALSLAITLDKAITHPHFDVSHFLAALTKHRDECLTRASALHTWQVVFSVLRFSEEQSVLSQSKDFFRDKMLHLEEWNERSSAILCYLALFYKRALLKEEITQTAELFRSHSVPDVFASSLALFFAAVLQPDLDTTYWAAIISNCLAWLELSLNGNDTVFQYHTLQLFLALQQKCQSAPLDVARNWNEFNQRSFEQVLAHLTELLSKSKCFLQLLASILVHAPTVGLSMNMDSLVLSLLCSNCVALQVASYDLLLRCLRDEKMLSKLVQTGKETTGPSTTEIEIAFPKNLQQILDDMELKLSFSEQPVNKQLAYLLVWSLLLESLVGDSSLRTNIGVYLRKTRLGSAFLSNLFVLMDLNPREHIVSVTVHDITERSLRGSLPTLAYSLYFSMLKSLPIVVRIWWLEDVDRKTAIAVEKFTTKFLSPCIHMHHVVDNMVDIIEHELLNIQNSKEEYENFHIKPNQVSKEVTAVYEKDEMSLTIIIKLPESFPLRNVEVEGIRLGISEQLWRKWLLSMNAMLLTQDYSILDAVLMFKQNLDKHFTGVDVCPICYSLLHATTRSLPNFQCKTCKNKFHSQCIYNWVSVSHKNDCPLCRSNLF